MEVGSAWVGCGNSILSITLKGSTFTTINTHQSPSPQSQQCAATLRICADGGANRLYEREQQGATACHPHVIIGDLDSIRPEVAAHYRDRGTQVLDLSHDQDSTDLQKCVDYIETHLGGEDGTEGGVDHIIAFGTCPMEFVCASVHDLAAGKTQGTGLRKGSVCGAAVWE